MGLLQKVIAGGPTVKSRFHTQDGDRIDVAGLRYLPHCVASTVGRIVFGKRPRAPWLGYRTIRRLETLLEPDWRMIEWGSGMSTEWFAERLSHVYSIEHNAEWQQKVTSDLERGGITNVTYKLLQGSEYPAAAHVEDDSVDFILVDGTLRHGCMQTALRKIRPGGWIYLDNADKEADDPQGDVTLAENLLLEHVRRHGRSHEYFIDLIPTYLAASKGLLAQVDK